MKNNLLSKELSKTKDLCNEFIRYRDMQRDSVGLFAICISCGKRIDLDKDGKNKNYHAGHYWRENDYSSVRFDVDNIHGQCYRCNRLLSGNYPEYEIKLEHKIGIDGVSRLEYKRNQVKKWTFTELEELQKYFKEQIKVEKTRLGIIKNN